jgi:hypothetical protein
MSDSETLRIELDEEAYELLAQLQLEYASKLLSRAADSAGGGACKISADDIRRIAENTATDGAADDTAATAPGQDGPPTKDQRFSANRVLLVLGTSILIGSGVALGAVLIPAVVHNDTVRIFIIFAMIGTAAVLIGAAGLIVARYTANHTRDPRAGQQDLVSQEPAKDPRAAAAPLQPAAELPGGSQASPQSTWLGTRRLRTILAIAGFFLLVGVVIATFASSGQGARDLRSQVVGAVTTLVAVIVGVYFGARTAPSSAAAAGPTTAAPGLALPDPKNPNPQFTVGQAGTYTPVVTGTPPPAVSVAGALPGGLTLDARTGAITGTPASGTAENYPVTLTASNGISPDATLNLTLKVSNLPGPALPDPKNPNPHPMPEPA